VPFIVWLSYGSQPSAIAGAGALFGVAALSDWLDGYVARRRGCTTAFGALLDPLVDKVLMLALLFTFADRGLLPMWLPLLNMAREFLVSGLRQGLSTHEQVIGANWMGKTKYVLQVGVVGLCYAHLLLQGLGRRLPGGLALLFWAALGMTAVSYAFLLVFALQHRPAVEARPPGPTAQDCE
jgi:CDP-diacylglycerol--glycerol-3-phosphate 3-phosphatidyltransferase